MSDSDPMDGMDSICRHPARNGQHEAYVDLKRTGWICKACGEGNGRQLRGFLPPRPLGSYKPERR